MTDEIIITGVADHYESSARLPPSNEFLTYDPESIKHIITDETLSMLDYAKRDLEFEGMLLFGGLALGGLIPFIEACVLFHGGKDFSGLNLVAIIVFCIAVSLGSVCGFLFKRKDKFTTDVIKQIRARTKMRIEREKKHAKA